MTLTSRLSLLALFIGIIGTSCSKDDKDIPPCIQQEIDSRVTTGSIQLTSVTKYEFQGEDVFLFTYEGGADLQSPILDSDCNTICSLGGITGNVECNEVNFGEEAEELKVVWED